MWGIIWKNEEESTHRWGYVSWNKAIPTVLQRYGIRESKDLIREADQGAMLQWFNVAEGQDVWRVTLVGQTRKAWGAQLRYLDQYFGQWSQSGVARHTRVMWAGTPKCGKEYENCIYLKMRKDLVTYGLTWCPCMLCISTDRGAKYRVKGWDAQSSMDVPTLLPCSESSCNWLAFYVCLVK